MGVQIGAIGSAQDMEEEGEQVVEKVVVVGLWALRGTSRGKVGTEHRMEIWWCCSCLRSCSGCEGLVQ